MCVCPNKCVCLYVVSQSKVVLTGTLAAVWLLRLCTIISRYSKQTDSPSLKLSLEASDEMAQIMRHIINHRQGAAGSVYMCHTLSLPLYVWHIHIYTHTEPTTKRVEQRKSTVASERSPEIITKAAVLFISCLIAEPRDHYPSSTFIQLMAALADWSSATILCRPRIR